MTIWLKGRNCDDHTRVALLIICSCFGDGDAERGGEVASAKDHCDVTTTISVAAYYENREPIVKFWFAEQAGYCIIM